MGEGTFGKRETMNPQKRKALESAGWRFGDAADFLSMTDEERLPHCPFCGIAQITLPAHGLFEDESFFIILDRDSLGRSEEHTSELSHQIISYAVFCLKKKKKRSDMTQNTRSAIPRPTGDTHISY